MEIKRIITGALDENCYVLIKNNTAIIVDPGDDYLNIKEAIGDNNVLAVLITHSHFDHIGALRNFLTKRSIKIFKRSNLEEKEYTVGDFKFTCIHTPGHSKDSVTFYFKEDNCMFVGDFIFKESIGRTDFPLGSYDAIISSIKEKLYTLDKGTAVLPGHGEDSVIENEIRENPYTV